MGCYMFNHRRLFLLILGAAIASSLGRAQNLLVQSYPLNSYVRYLDGQWEGIRHASDGNIYFASSSQSAHHGAAFFRYSPATQHVTMLAEDITAICGEDPQTNPQGKIHANIQEMHGWVFFTTHFGADDRPGGITGWTGGHLLGFRFTDTGSNNYFNTPVGGFHNYGVIYPDSPGYTAYSGIAVDPVQNYIYVFATGELARQVSYVFRYNAALDNSATRVNLGAVYGSFGASLYWFADPAGDIWFAIYNDNGALHRIHHDTGAIDRYDNVLPSFIRQDSNTVDSSFDRAIQWMAPVSATKAVFTYNAGGMLYEFDSSQTTTSTVPASAFRTIKWIGPSYIGSTVGANRVFWYQRAGGVIGHQGCDTADTVLPPACQDYHLMSVSLDPASGYAVTDHGRLIDQSGRTVWRIPSMMTDGTDNNVFMVGDWWTYDTAGNPIPGDDGVNNTLRYHYSGGIESYLDEPRGEFFAVATLGAPGSVSVTPASTVLGSGAVQQFTATVQGQPNQPVIWSLNPSIGSITSSGFYQAPAIISALQIVTVTATNAADLAKSGTATVILQPAGTFFVTGKALGTLRNDYSGWVGMKILVGAAPVTVTSLGRLMVSGNTGTHVVKIVQASNGVDVAGASASVGLAGGSPGNFVYAPLSTAITLNANTAYYIVTQETAGGDQWYDHNTTVQTTNVASVPLAVYSSGASYVTTGLGGQTYGPVDFQYGGTAGPPSITQQPQSATVTAGQAATFSVSASGAGLGYQWQSQAPGSSIFSNIPNATSSSYTTPVTQQSDNGMQFRCVVSNGTGSTTSNAATLTVQPAGSNAAFVTGKVLGTLRNDYSGWVGMKILVGSAPVTVTSLGRLMVSGNSGTHVVKIVQASNGVDVAGGSASVGLAGGSPGNFVYAPLSTAITLNANTAYYLVTQETAAGDQWYDYNTTVQTTNVASVPLAVYSSGASYVTTGLAGQTYGPVDFQYGGTAGPPFITQQPQGATVTAGQAATFSVSASGGGLGYQWQSQAPGGSVFLNIPGATSSSYTTPVTQQSDNGTQFRCVVSNGNGSITSNAATLTVLPTGGGTFFVTGRAFGALRNNYTGWVGMRVLVGPSPLTITALGRYAVPGNSGTHTVKVVQAASGVDVPGGSASVNLAGAIAGGFVYSTLLSPITLSANTEYYVVSQEVFGGDQWYDYNTIVQTTNAGTVISAVYDNGPFSYIAPGSAGQTYGPVDFRY